MRNLLGIALLMFVILAADAQPTVKTGYDQGNFSFKKQPYFSSFAIGEDHYFYFRDISLTNPVHTLIHSDKDGNIKYVNDIRVDAGSFNNSFSIKGIYALGSNIIALIENPDKSAGLHRLSYRFIRNGKIEAKDHIIGSLEFEKLTNSGNWHAALSPDKKHLAIVGQMPRDKDAPNQYRYFFLDESMKEIGKGNLSFPDDSKRVHFNHFLASNKGDLYLIENEFDKTYIFPKVYKGSVGGTKGDVIPVQPADAAQKIMSYTAKVNEAGDLILAGYYMKKANVVIGEEQAVGNWWYNTSIAKMQVNAFEKPVSNLKAQDLIQNGNTWFLIGEQYKSERERSAQQGLNLEENYTYKHNDLLITAFDGEGNKRFEIPVSKKGSARNFDADLYAAYGILNGKLSLVYHDVYGKYFPNTSYDHYKLPVVVNITNDGLMEEPVQLAKELNVTTSSFILYPQLFSTANNQLLILSGNGHQMRGVVFQ